MCEIYNDFKIIDVDKDWKKANIWNLGVNNMTVLMKISSIM